MIANCNTGIRASTGSVTDTTITGSLGCGISAMMPVSSAEPLLISECRLEGNRIGIECFLGSANIENSLISRNETGIMCTQSICRIVGNTISGNVSLGAGAGIYCRDGCTTLIQGNVIRDNTANGRIVSPSSFTYSGGGGICSYRSDTTILDNDIVCNQGLGRLGKSGCGGGICVYGGAATIRGNRILDNVATILGGGVFCDGAGSLIDGNVIVGNTATDNYYCSPVSSAGGISCAGAQASNNVIAGNRAELAAGAVKCTSSTLIGNTIAGNDAPGSGIDLWGSNRLENNIIVFNSGGIRFCSGNAGPIAANCVYGNADGNYIGLPDQTEASGNISVDPLFVDPANGDYRLRWDSPCVDAGANEGTSEFDILGNPRVVDGNMDGLPVVDMGAFEYQPVRVTLDVMPGDASNRIQVNKNGMVTVAIIGTPELDVRSINPSSIVFGPGEAVEVHGRAHIEDANGDGRMDMVLHFRGQDIGLAPGMTTIHLTGRLTSGEPFVGSDAVTVAPNGKARK